jgi:transposase
MSRARQSDYEGGQAAASTVEALVYQLRQSGKALKDPNARRRLAELSEQQLHEVSARLQQFQPDIARPWSASEIKLLVQLWSDLHG